MVASFQKQRTQQGAQQYMSAAMLGRDRRRRRHDRVEKAIVQRLLADLPRGAVVADVPCGNGRMTQIVTRSDLRVLPMDFSRAMLTAMPEHRPGCPHLPRRVQADVSALPLPDKCVDLFLNLRLSHHIGDPAALSAVFRALGELCGRLHAAGFFHRLRVQDLLLRQIPEDARGAAEFVMIDREFELPQARRFTRSECVKCLAVCYCRIFLYGHTLTVREAAAFARGYRAELGSRWPKDVRHILNCISRRVQELAGPGCKYERKVPPPLFERRSHRAAPVRQLV